MPAAGSATATSCERDSSDTLEIARPVPQLRCEKTRAIQAVAIPTVVEDRFEQNVFTRWPQFTCANLHVAGFLPGFADVNSTSRVLNRLSEIVILAGGARRRR